MKSANKTWVDREEVCYPSGAQVRRFRALCPDGKVRAGRCGIADTFFSIPGYVWAFGKTVRGYVTSGDNGFEFRVVTYRKNHAIFNR